ncbi:GTP 3',8-cyclase MoaA [Orrella sp. JC864]|uniref:GTP 3',8-cyclase MoaA n=1 Tax=Orrella sp. JC864 TaxID=3120298 RepID=UPI00300B74DF
MNRVIPLVDQRRLDQAVRVQASGAQARGVDTSGQPPRDARGRPLRDLRISVTDRCNFRCGYCMPRDVFDGNYRFLPQPELLSFEEITRLAGLFAQAGVQKIRLTGGEPLLRKHVEKLIAMLAGLRGIGGQPLDLTLTTNGILLARKAQALREAGLARVTVSLDALDEALFRRMSDADFSPDDVLRGIDAAAQAGLPVKVNMVVRRGVNDHQILPMARRFRGSGHVLRFIEYMDVGNTNGWNMAEVVPGAEVLARLAAQWPLRALTPQYPGEVAERWAYEDGQGEIGLITSVTQAFCGDCNRARLSPEGRLFLCLFASRGHDLRALLRSGADDARIRGALSAIWGAREDAYSESRGSQPDRRDAPRIEMSYIGG